MTDRNKRLLMKAMQSESTWLQKALFALGKAQEARATVEELSGEALDELGAKANGKAKWASLPDFQDVLEARVHTIMEDLQEQRRVVT
ncbi:MAG: hypothetical protein RQ751_14050 [Longimicrobiales bacterium]|nr:hypothetical protein [Longimicrobiales bacterium]